MTILLCPIWAINWFRLGQGGMGAVYEAKDQNLGHTVALKQRLVSGARLEQAFKREARILAPLESVRLNTFAEAEPRKIRHLA